MKTGCCAGAGFCHATIALTSPRLLNQLYRRRGLKCYSALQLACQSPSLRTSESKLHNVTPDLDPKQTDATDAFPFVSIRPIWRVSAIKKIIFTFYHADYSSRYPLFFNFSDSSRPSVLMDDVPNAKGCFIFYDGTLQRLGTTLTNMVDETRNLPLRPSRVAL
jgi:hypothetical protein